MAPNIAKADPDIVNKIKTDITPEQKESIIAIERLKEACLNYAYVPCRDIADNVKYLAWQTVAKSLDDYKEICSLPKLDLETGHYITGNSHLIETQIKNLQASYIKMRVAATESSSGFPTCYNSQAIINLAGPLSNNLDNVINASPDYIILKQREAKMQNEIKAQQIAEDKSKQEKLAEDARKKAEIEREKAKKNMESLAKQLKNELKNRLRNAEVDGVDRQDVCVCACLNWNGLHDVVDKFLTEAYFVDTGEHLYQSPPSDLSSNHCSGFGAAMEYPNYIKRLNKYRASETLMCLYAIIYVLM